MRGVPYLNIQFCTILIPERYEIEFAVRADHFDPSGEATFVGRALYWFRGAWGGEQDHEMVRSPNSPISCAVREGSTERISASGTALAGYWKIK